MPDEGDDAGPDTATPPTMSAASTLESLQCLHAKAGLRCIVRLLSL
ncbi:hypothetical protein [Lysobacter sp. MMG2]|nr:hypothetical protein [Lysobacter sp. MMG2]